MNYSYNTPEEAIASLESAYTNNDLEGIINSKDFMEEAKVILDQAKYEYDTSDELLLEETAKLLQLGLTQSLQENGFPDFSYLKSELYGLQKVSEIIYVINKKITYPDATIYETRIFLSNKNDVWKVVLVEE
ncbi:hypothetical protein R1T16_11180 [Flavobacterium sp. DG1-102-2]|uniref:hypothetical protein n=1 Tax=Flavobacterium sp. DG1-102-2 TaxID=3081663 RepID=UPI00294900E3|nr:hypothetical protein [Flavobacterium sp. DG1-102-2]MDV6168991.1 hypothetical protein [Flavobacterium sp. DG1-102-2]